MKNCYLLILFLFAINIYSQENIHWLVNQDKQTDCSFLKSGKFVNEEKDNKITEGYSMEFRGEYVIENVENGKYFLKSKITYSSECSYNIKVLETNIPGYENQIGKIFYTEILETAKIDKLVKIRSKGEDWKILVLRKIQD